MLGKYARPNIEPWVETPERALDLPEKKMGVVLHLLARFKSKIVRQVRDVMDMHKQEYDDSGDDYKTPFALRDIGENPEFPFEREMVFTNVLGSASTYGCTGCCGFCGVDSMPVRKEDVIATPLGQQKHFYDELIGYLRAYNSDPDFIDQVILLTMHYGDNDPFDDPNIGEMIEYLHEKCGVVFGLATYVPEKGQEIFEHYAELEQRHRALNDLTTFMKVMELLKKDVKSKGITNVAQFVDYMGGIEHSTKIERLIELMKSLRETGHNLASVEMILSNEQYGFQEALDHFGLGDISEYYVCDDAAIARLQPKVDSLTSSESEKLEDWREWFEYVEDDYKCMIRYHGINPLEFKFDEDSFGELKSKIEFEESFLDGKPSVGDMRVSVVKRQAETVARLIENKKLAFTYVPKDVPGGFVKTIGEKALSAANDSFLMGITAGAGIEISPFGAFNLLPGNVSDEYPQGRLLVPYMGLQKNNKLANDGDDIADVLENAIVMREAAVSGGDFDECFKINVFDGDNRVRKIWYRRDDFTVIKDVVVKEDVKSLAGLAILKSGHWGEWAFKKPKKTEAVEEERGNE